MVKWYVLVVNGTPSVAFHSKLRALESLEWHASNAQPPHYKPGDVISIVEVERINTIKAEIILEQRPG